MSKISFKFVKSKIGVGVVLEFYVIFLVNRIIDYLFREKKILIFFYMIF